MENTEKYVAKTLVEALEDAGGKAIVKIRHQRSSYHTDLELTKAVIEVDKNGSRTVVLIGEDIPEEPSIDKTLETN